MMKGVQVGDRVRFVARCPLEGGGDLHGATGVVVLIGGGPMGCGYARWLPDDEARRPKGPTKTWGSMADQLELLCRGYEVRW